MRTFLLLLTAGVLLTGCGENALHFPKPVFTFNQPGATFDIPAKELYAKAKQVVTASPISLSIDQEHNGAFITGYKEFPGAWHIARRWQERTRFRVSVVPDFDDPTGRSQLSVTEETQTRATDGQKWSPATDVNRTGRARDLLKEIEQQLRPLSSTQS